MDSALGAGGYLFVKQLVQTHCHLCTAGKLHFVKFETAKVEQVVDFIEAKGLLLPAAPHGASGDQRVSIKATGGGAFKFAELFEASQTRRSPWQLGLMLSS